MRLTRGKRRDGNFGKKRGYRVTGVTPELPSPHKVDKRMKSFFSFSRERERLDPNRSPVYDYVRNDRHLIPG